MVQRWMGAWVALGIVAAGCGGTIVGVPTMTPTVTVTHTRTRRPTNTPTPTTTPAPPLGPGANVTFFGLAAADDMPLQPIGTDGNGRLIYERRFGQGFSLVVEGRPGISHSPVGLSAFNYSPDDPAVRPDMQMLVSRPLGNGSTTVCDNTLHMFGGVPSVDPANYALTQHISDAINDLGCRFNNGTGNPGGRGPDDACTLFPDGEFHFVDPNSTAQFCGRVASPFGFPEGDTIATVRLSDQQGVVGATRQIVVRVNPNAGTPTTTGMPQPSTTATRTPTPVPPPGGPGEISYFGIAQADAMPLQSVGTDSEGRPVFERRIGRGFILVVEGKPLTGHRTIGNSAFNYDPIDPIVRPDLQVIVSRPLGDGSPTVCDNGDPVFGGVPAVDPPDFAERQATSDAINDLGCRFNDGTGNPSGRAQADACTLFGDGTFHFVDNTSTVQFCAAISGAYGFPRGETLVSARIREGAVRQIVIRITG
ncbi:MAG: hypothetical protein HYR72_22990 [Deltaproteobacteria bacterium]|nr:hypothetical protein [Deltaproteobacteria bacterium]MBI3390715.1 hypothetical protein [Deltaproteobacteria bacterium]